MKWILPPWVSVPLAAIGKFFKAIPWKVYALLAAIAVVWLIRVDGFRDGYAQAKAEADALAAKVHAEQQAALIAEQEKARKELQKANAKMLAIETNLIENGRKEIEKREKLIADYRAGRIRLRERFQCPAASAASGTSAAAAVGDGEARTGLSGTDAEFFIREASRADEITRQLGEAQTVIVEYQRICGAQNP